METLTIRLKTLQTEENEELIAVFTGNFFKIDDDWNTIMNIVEKIEGSYTKSANYFKFQNHNNFVVIYSSERNRQDGVIYQSPYGYNFISKETAFYHAIIEFIKWYNSNQQY